MTVITIFRVEFGEVRLLTSAGSKTFNMLGIGDAAIIVGRINALPPSPREEVDRE